MQGRGALRGVLGGPDPLPALSHHPDFPALRTAQGGEMLGEGRDGCRGGRTFGAPSDAARRLRTGKLDHGERDSDTSSTVWQSSGHKGGSNSRSTNRSPESARKRTDAGRGDLFLPGGKTKARRPRRVPISTVLQGVLAARRIDPAGSRSTARGGLQVDGCGSAARGHLLLGQYPGRSLNACRALNGRRTEVAC